MASELESQVNYVNCLRRYHDEEFFFMIDSPDDLTKQDFNNALAELSQGDPFWDPANIVLHDDEPWAIDNLRKKSNRYIRRFNKANGGVKAKTMLFRASAQIGTASEYVSGAQARIAAEFPGPANAIHVKRRRRRQIVPKLTLINGSELVAVIPNYYLSAGSTNGHVPTGGPGGFPRPKSRIEYENYPIPAPPMGNTKVRVYVLDTTYPDDRRDASANGWPDWFALPQAPGSKFAEILMSDLIKDPDLKEFTEQTVWFDDPTWDRDIWDHGPFICDLIFRYAPTAEITLIETMNRKGVGTVATLKKVLDWLKAEFERQKNEHIDDPKIVNMSFYFDLPSFANIQSYLNDIADIRAVGPGPLTAAVDRLEKEQKTIAGDFDERFSDMVLQLIDIVFSVDPTNTLFLAAAGNNHDPNYPHPPALQPAALAFVVGVAASGTAVPPALASYSHEADRTYGSGSNTVREGRRGFGGAAEDLKSRYTKPTNSPRLIAMSIGGVIGPYLNDDDFHLKAVDDPLHPGYSRLKMDTGYAEWSGTSFATPEITGRVAAEAASGTPLNRAILIMPPG